MTKSFSFDSLAELEALRGAKVLVYCTNDRSPKGLSAVDLLAFSRVLHQAPRAERLDLILHSHGGEISAARALALQLRECTNHLNVLIPCKARSSATLLCLAADEIILAPSAEFSPIDPIITPGAEASSPLPKKISSEDVRAFRAMAEEWFDLRSEESRVQVLTLLCNRFLPTTMAALYRADRYVRRVGQELIELQLPDCEPARRARIVDQLIAGHSNHQDVIGYRDILKLGLRARLALELESKLMTQIVAGCQNYMNADDAGDVKARCRAMLLGRNGGVGFVTREHVLSKVPARPQGAGQPARQTRRASGEWADILTTS